MRQSGFLIIGFSFLISHFSFASGVDYAPGGMAALRFLKDRSTTDVLVYEFKGMPPSRKLEGALILPKDTGPWPLIVVNCGATNQPIDKAMEVGPYLARRGYVTVTPRYSFCGPKPGEEGIERKRDAELDSRLCVAAVDFARTLPFVRPERPGVAGISAGGFLILHVLNGQHPFASAAVVSAGIREIPDPDYPLNHVSIPVLAMVGTADTVIPPECGALLAQALRADGKRSRLIRYEGAPHDLFHSGGPQVLKDLADFFDGTLKSK